MPLRRLGGMEFPKLTMSGASLINGYHMSAVSTYNITGQQKPPRHCMAYKNATIFDKIHFRIAEEAIFTYHQSSKPTPTKVERGIPERTRR